MRTGTFAAVAFLAILLLGAVGLLLGARGPATVAGFMLGGAASYILLRLGAPPPPPPERPPEDVLAPGIAALFAAHDEPLLLIARGRVAQANAAAQALLGEHIEGEDVRLAIRHPQASEALAGEGAPVVLTGLGARDRRYEMVVRRLPDGRLLVRLADRSLSHAAERMRVDFVANASHELRTPLAALLGFIETLEDDQAADDRKTRARFLKIMAGEARRMRDLVDDLMSLSRVEADRFAPPSTPVPLAPLAAEVASAVTAGQHLAPDRIRVQAAGEAVVLGDRAQLSQLLHNLIGNALKYGRPGTPVQVRVEAEGDTARLVIADEGDGIPPDHLPRVTERFYRVDPGRSRALGGTGLGLSIVKHIVERHRGTLRIESSVGQGTTVTASFPAA